MIYNIVDYCLKFQTKILYRERQEGKSQSIVRQIVNWGEEVKELNTTNKEKLSRL